MNVVREINQINERELDLALQGASWHDEYKDSAYIFVGGLNFELTEGDVITIFSQYGEVMDVNLPRDKETGKPRGFAFLMYEDQRSTVLAVDNLNGAKVLDRTLRVDHVKDYKQKRTKGATDGEWLEAEEQSFNARPEMIVDDAAGTESDASSAPEIDPEDPMYDFLLQQWREQHQAKKAKKKTKGKHKDETPEERAARKAKKRAKKEKKAAGNSDTLRGVEALLQSLGTGGPSTDDRSGRRRSNSPRLHRDDTRARSRSPARGEPSKRQRSRSPRRRSISPDPRDSARGRDYDRDRSRRR